MDSNSSILLTQNGVLYLSLGFKQHFQLQVLTSRVGEQAELQLVLYDGLAYIGALYYPRMGEEVECQKVIERTVVRIYPLSAVRNQPVILESIQIISSPLEQLLGRQIISLEELMRRKSTNPKPFTATYKIEDTQPRKLLKTTIQDGKYQAISEILLEEQPENIEQETEKNSICSSKHQQTENKLAINKQSNILNPIQSLQTQKTNSAREQHDSKEMKSNDDIVQEILTQKKPIVNKQPQYVYEISSEDQPISFSISQKNKRKEKQTISDVQTGQVQSLQIRDLYERMHRFQIQCRINHLTSFISQRGTKCIRLIAIDSLGDEVICLLFENSNQNMNPIKLNRGRTYIFRNGQVQNSESGLTILLSWSGVSQSNKSIPSFLPQRTLRVGQIQRKISTFMDRTVPSDNPRAGNKNQEYNISGVFMGFKQNPKIIRNGFRVTGTLCDHDQRVCVIFSMVADELSSFPVEGTVVSLHNFTIIEQERIIRLQSSKKGYIIDQTYNYHEYFSDLKHAAASNEWKRIDLRNISQVTYIHRNIGQILRLMSRTIDFQQIFSEFDCFITNICQKKRYSSCLVCRKATRQQNGPLSYCLGCKKPQLSMTRYIFEIQLADSTGSINIIYNRDQLEQLLGMSLEQYSSYDEQQRIHYQELIRYKCIVVRLKSQRVTGGDKHQATLISKFIPQRSLQQIKDLAIQEKTNFSRAF